MKSLVIYDSNFGNTKLVADVIAKNLVGNPKSISVKEFDQSDLVGVDLVVWGSPINGWKPTEATMSTLKSLAEESFAGKKFTTFDTRVKLFLHGDAMLEMAERIEKLGGIPIVEPQEFYVQGKDGPLFDGELEKAALWAKSIASKD